ncbi:MAG: cryptochrome/photolyase family protein [Planctomycetota bacterium]
MSDYGHETLVIILGNQLFPFAEIKRAGLRDASFFMAEDVGLCTYVKHHQQKIVLFLAAMRAHADELRSNGCDVHYESLEDQTGPALKTKYETKVARFAEGQKIERLVMFEIEDKFFEERIEALAQEQGWALEFLDSPMFVTSRDEFADYLGNSGKRPFMAKFYERQRKRLSILVDDDGKPTGGQWSFDADNRKNLPKKVEVPRTEWAKPTPHVVAVKALVAQRFADHPGVLDSASPEATRNSEGELLKASQYEAPTGAGFWLPTTRRQALAWLNDFLKDRFKDFGPYEDALSNRDDVLFHSALSPMMNLGLLTPREIVDRALDYADDNDVPVNSLEGFVRQIIGWREFIRGIYQNYDAKQSKQNFWNHARKLKPCWYDATTGLPPLDDAIDKARRLGWTHHIERLMVLANLMNLCEVEPRRAHDWFMEMFVDSSDWVMGPNVYGMGLMSDGGLFATKPYICGSNYLVKMSDRYKKTDDWCETVDGLYWRFVDNHQDFFSGNPRLSMMLGTLNKMDANRKRRIFTKAEQFIERVTD